MTNPHRKRSQQSHGYRWLRVYRISPPPIPLQLDGLFRALGFLPVARHRSKGRHPVSPGGESTSSLTPRQRAFASLRPGPWSVDLAIALRVKDARAAAHYAQILGAEVLLAAPVRWNSTSPPCAALAAA